MTDAATKAIARLTTEQRISVLEELLNERYSVRAFLPQPVPRETIDRLLRVAQRTASWCNSQPWQVVIASGEAKEKFRKIIYAEAASGAGDDHDFTPPREYLGVYLERRRESGFQLYNTLGIARGDKPVGDGHVIADLGGPRFQAFTQGAPADLRGSAMHNPFGRLRLVRSVSR